MLFRSVRNVQRSCNHSFVVVFTQPRMNALSRFARVFPWELKGFSLRKPRLGLPPFRLAGPGNLACVGSGRTNPGLGGYLSFGSSLELTESRVSHFACIDTSAWLGLGSLDAHSTQGRDPVRRRIRAGLFPTCFAGRSRRVCVTSEQ